MSPELLHARRCKLAGCIVLAVGALAAILVYWIGSRSANLADDAAMQGYYKSEAHQMGMLYGKQGLMMDDLTNALKQPANQALVILAVSVVVAVGCFIFARYPDAETKAE